MSSKNKGHSLKVPTGWRHCPCQAKMVIQDKFLAFKTPLSSAYQVKKYQFSVNKIFGYLRSQNIEMGLWIDLTNTDRYYKEETTIIREYGCEYLKLPCEGHDEAPSEKKINAFVDACDKFIKNNSSKIIGVHCTHGFNRTGFLIISYLVKEGSSVEDALREFATARPPGIYKGDYINELYKRHDDINNAPPPPPRPFWRDLE